MSTSGRILLADNDAAFLQQTSELLRREGFAVDPVADGERALAFLRDARSDVLVSDLGIAGGDDLALIRRVAELGSRVPVIIVTGHPSIQSAIASVELGVVAYLLKPVQVPALTARVRAAIQTARGGDRSAPDTQAINAFVDHTLHNVRASLDDLERLTRAMAGHAPDARPCHALNCPRAAQLEAALAETIEVLRETKASFRSNALATLRRKLELLTSDQ